MNQTILRSGLLILSLSFTAPMWVHANEGHKEMSMADREKALNEMSDKLKLTQDQKNKVREIKEEKHRKMTEAKTEAHAKIREVLNVDQQMKFDKMIADKK